MDGLATRAMGIRAGNGHDSVIFSLTAYLLKSTTWQALCQAQRMQQEIGQNDLCLWRVYGVMMVRAILTKFTKMMSVMKKRSRCYLSI